MALERAAREARNRPAGPGVSGIMEWCRRQDAVDRGRFDRLMAQLALPPTSPDPRVRAKAIEAMELGSRILDQAEAGAAPLDLAAHAELMVRLIDVAQAAAGRPPLH